MKQKDYIVIALIIVLGAIVSLAISKTFIGGKQAVQSAEVVEAISADFPPTDKRYFNSEAFDPTQTITINANQNTAPFNAATGQ